MHDFRSSRHGKSFSPCCAARGTPTPGLLLCLWQAPTSCPGHTLPTNHMVLQVLLETKPGTDLPPRVFFWLVAACTKPMGKNPRLGYVGWWGPSSGVIWVDECTQLWRRSLCTQPLPLPLQLLWPAAFEIPLMQMLLGRSTMSAWKKCTMKGIFHYITQATMLLLFSYIPQWILRLCYRIQKLLANQNPAFLCRSESREKPVANHWQGGVKFLFSLFLSNSPSKFDMLSVTFDMTIFFRYIFLSYKGRFFTPLDISEVLSFTEDI